MRKTRPGTGRGVVFLTGAGLSADSGIATYRGAGGLYRGIAAESLLTPRGLRDQPSLVHGLCDDLREASASAEPNAMHSAIARLKKIGRDDVTVLTQNVDDLLERAGCTDVIHLHGRIGHLREVANSKRTISFAGRYWDGPEESGPEGGYRFRAPLSNSYYRPDVVLFGELAPAYAVLRSALRNLGSDGLLVVIGTSGQVLPVAEFARTTPARSVLVNLHPSEDIDAAAFDLVIHQRAVDAAARIETICETHLHKGRQANFSA